MKKLRGVVAVAAALVAASSFGQDRRLVEAFHCPDIDNDIARLECFDTAYSDFIAAADAPGNWFIESKTDPLDDSITTFIALNAREGGSALSGPHQLVIRCDASDLAAWITWRRVFGSDSNIVTYRVGKAVAKTEEWIPATSGKVTFYPGDAKQFVRDLMKSDRFAARLEMDDGDEKLATFNVQGLEQAAAPIKQACLSEPRTAHEEIMEAMEGLNKKEDR